MWKCHFKRYIGVRQTNPYNKIIIEFAKACKIFVGELRKIKDEINLDFDFEDFFNEVKEDTDGEAI